jgi:hypothetical protein
MSWKYFHWDKKVKVEDRNDKENAGDRLHYVFARHL